MVSKTKKAIYRSRTKNSTCRKRSRTSCRRMSGCKYASGSKRRYCRKTKNRRA